ncbi:hypothetical protein [uncultured Microscilla sp.]|uniref:hypothetical protein n=1 Tax=uncultured Microscilla sp. TaxID=432653 RepID=UPI00262151BF|nr:hypothetical protein [uncultured Microscilla sp.]
MIQIILEQQNLVISYDKVKNILICRWVGYQSVEGIQQGCEAILAHAKTQNQTYLLNNLAELKGTFTAANDWINNEWLPKAISEGLVRTAYVYSPDVFAKFALNNLLKPRQTSDKYTYNAFGTVEDAIDWLLTGSVES